VSGDAQLSSSDDDADEGQPYAPQLHMLHQHNITAQQQQQDVPVVLQRGAGSHTKLDQHMQDAAAAAEAWGDDYDEQMDTEAAEDPNCYSDEYESDQADDYGAADVPSASYMYRHHMLHDDDDHMMYRLREQWPGQYNSSGQQYGHRRVQRLADLQLLTARLPPYGRHPTAKRSHQALLDFVQQEQQQEQQRAREERLVARRLQQQQGWPQPKRRRKKQYSSLAPLAYMPGSAAAAAAAASPSAVRREFDGVGYDDGYDEQDAAAAAALPRLPSLPSSSATGNNGNSSYQQFAGGSFGMTSSGSRGRGRGRGSRGRGRHSGRFTRGGGGSNGAFGRGGRGAFTAAHAQAVAAAEEAAGGALPPPGGDRSWLYELLRAEQLFTPCPNCSSQHKGWAVLLSYFDPEQPQRSYCGYCPEIAELPRLLKIKRQGGALLCVEPEVLAGECWVADELGLW
jgi:hypothetical protein